MEEKIKFILQKLNEKIKDVSTSEQCQALRVNFLGKNGLITELLKDLKNYSNEQKPVMGAIINKAKAEAEQLITQVEAKLKTAELEQKLMTEQIDVTLDLPHKEKGSLNSITLEMQTMCNILTGLGFSQVEHHEMDYDKNVFELLNVPKDHPSRDMQDTYYFNDEIVLSTQTTAFHSRAYKNFKPPFKAFCVGRVFRKDEIDATHTPAFYQIDGVYVDKKVNMDDLKGTLEFILKKYLGEDTKIRFRSSYFPFTEPSVEVDATCSICHGKGCAGCKGVGYFEILGAGLINPKVLELNGIDSKEYSGYAFGFGFDRFPKSKYKIPYSRLMFDNDARFMKNFR